MRLKPVRGALALAAGLLLAAPAVADQAAQPDGSVIGATCFGCHGEFGQGSGAVARIAGRPATALERALLAFRAGTAEATVMGRIARGYTDEEIRAVAAYFGSLR